MHPLIVAITLAAAAAAAGVYLWMKGTQRRGLARLRAEHPGAPVTELLVVVGQERRPGVAALLPDRILVLQPARDPTPLHLAFECFAWTVDATPADGRSRFGMRCVRASAGDVTVDLLLPPAAADAFLAPLQAAQARP